MLKQGSLSFFAASLALPQSLRKPASALYAFCRLADDAIDLEDDKATALIALKDRLARIYDGNPLPIPADRAFAEVVAVYRIPRELPEGLLEGFAWDAEGRRYETISELNAYGARVAGTVGAMMARLMGVRAADVAARACDLGVAMQLTNIARDVGEDARAGRLYLPMAWMREAGIDPDAWLANPEFNDALASVIQRLLKAADELYVRASRGISRLPMVCRPSMHAARLIYAEIGREVERQGLDSVSRRAYVPTPRKVGLLAAALAASTVPGRSAAGPIMEEVRFLVDAMVAAGPNAITAHPHRMPWWNLGGRIEWIVDLFDRLERRERMMQPIATRSMAARSAATH
jgi:15-cis-phytoene synthase